MVFRIDNYTSHICVKHLKQKDSFESGCCISTAFIKAEENSFFFHLKMQVTNRLYNFLQMLFTKREAENTRSIFNPWQRLKEIR